MRWPRFSPPPWIDLRVVGAFVALLVAVAILVGALNTGHTDNKAEKAQQKGATAQKQATQAQVGNSVTSKRLAQMGRCLLRKGLSARERAKCINLTLPIAQRGLPGLAGQQGRPGAQGRQGLPGVRGPRGPRGPLGPKGDPCLASIDQECVGPQGPVGGTGDKGSPGAAGANGAKGEKGEPGATGEAGPQGATGDPGAAGATGPQGDPGPAGPAGQPGPAGPPGAPGAAPASFSFSFVDGQGAQQTLTCTDPEGDLVYTCG